ncbi:MAG: hypothetical protein H6662_00915 [Ardenticatenaceae bacterium]|nr:hypothetical protein [Anaerolineales bacterium]MCB8920116.1 hypothetical protein [Ardenticatenaceae bacterium]MCB8991809.1 hypothetical protein [Ardenticatenaceae bacterium]
MKRMYPDDRVLVAYVPRPADFEQVQQAGWYRIPQRHAPKGLHAEYYAFYFGRPFGPQKWSIVYYAPRLGHELLRRIDLLPDEPNHPRAQDWYYKVQLGPLQKLSQPIISLRWRRITFIHTTGDRFLDAREINDLFVDGGEYVDRLFVALKERGLQPERHYQVKEGPIEYVAPLMILCRNGRIPITAAQIPTNQTQLADFVEEVIRETAVHGGIKTENNKQ